MHPLAGGGSILPAATVARRSGHTARLHQALGGPGRSPQARPPSIEEAVSPEEQDDEFELA
eukprot:12411360-Alexandrium_andersonii.AAC.1